ncbi:MAG: hypothetical protein FWG10_06950 [Eubacteriaceae bacterium]|nr:hypothetical protein [Eubacteriaceae bacterium]
MSRFQQQHEQPRHPAIREFWIGEENNRIVIGIFDDAKAGQTKEELLPVQGEGMLSFEPYQDGFIIGSGNLLYCFVDDMGNLDLEPVAP